MINREKIIIMTKLALYDRHYGESDNKIGSFFRHDYIYWRNFWARLYALFGLAILIGLYVVDRLIIKQEDLFGIDYAKEGSNILLFVLLVLAVYTALNSFKATREYSQAQKRINAHIELTKRLDYLSAGEKSTQREIQP